jgi:hypothetical protein
MVSPIWPGENWCDFGDLPESQCAHCQGDRIPPRRGEATETAIEVAKQIYGQESIMAEFKGSCASCLERIEPGQPIRQLQVSRAWIHEECP